jgi:hypothetical protein
LLISSCAFRRRRWFHLRADEPLFSMISAAAATPMPRQRRHYAFTLIATLIRFRQTPSRHAAAAAI